MTVRYYLLALLWIIINTGTACSSGNPTSSLLGFAAETAEAPVNITPGDAQAPSMPEFRGQYAIQPNSAQSGLEQLDSYRTRISVDFEGTRSGEISAGHIEAWVEVNAATEAVHHHVNTEASIPGSNHTPGISEFIRLGDQVYLTKAGQSSLFEAQVSPTEIGFLALEKLIILPAAVSAPPQSEQKQGLQLQHYTFTEADLDRPDITFEKAQGQLWVAETGNFVVEYSISATLKMTAPIPNAHILDRGALSLHYTLSDVNTDIDIALPDDVEPMITPLVDFPRLGEVEITAIYPALLEYTSIISPISATLFYQQGLPTRGWNEESAEVFQEKSRLIFSKDDDTLTVIITPIDDPRKIKVLLSLEGNP